MVPTLLTRSDVLSRIRGEFLEMPGLRLTSAQARRLWGLDTDTCDRALEVLIADHFLIRTRDGQYVLGRSVA
jgi:hypothetical protein